MPKLPEGAGAIRGRGALPRSDPETTRKALAFLRKAGPLLHGPEWQEATARDLRVSRRSLFNWMSERNTPPSEEELRQRLMPAYRKIALERVRQLEELRAFFTGKETEGDD